jgi:hypothetical protein
MPVGIKILRKPSPGSQRESDYMLRINPNVGEIRFGDKFYSALKIQPENKYRVGFIQLDGTEDRVLQNNQEIPIDTGQWLLLFEKQNEQMKDFVSFYDTTNGLRKEEFSALSSINDDRTSIGLVYKRNEQGLCYDENATEEVVKYHNFTAKLENRVAVEFTVNGRTITFFGYPLVLDTDLGFPQDRFVTKPVGRKNPIIETT